MLFGDLKAGDNFIFPCAVNDGKEFGIWIYIKLKEPVVPFLEGVAIIPTEGRGFSAINKKSGTFILVPDDAEVLLMG